MPRFSTLAVICLLTACSQVCPTKLSAPADSDRISSTRIGNGEVFVTRRSSGGAAGDLTYNVLACGGDLKRCDVIATVDTYGDSIPEAVANQGQLNLILNRRDSIFGFMNFSEEISQLSRGDISLAYRD